MKQITQKLTVAAILLAVAATPAWSKQKDHDRYNDDWSRSSQGYYCKLEQGQRHEHRKNFHKEHRLGQRIDERQSRQWRRIKQGMESGELTRKESRKLLKQQRKIKRMEARYEEDGRLSRKEAHELIERLDRASERIYLLKHNGRFVQTHLHHHDKVKRI